MALSLIMVRGRCKQTWQGAEGEPGQECSCESAAAKRDCCLNWQDWGSKKTTQTVNQDCPGAGTGGRKAEQVICKLPFPRGQRSVTSGINSPTFRLGPTWEMSRVPSVSSMGMPSVGGEG